MHACEEHRLLWEEAGRLGPWGASAAPGVLPAESGSQVSEASSASRTEGALRLRRGLHARRPHAPVTGRARSCNLSGHGRPLVSAVPTGSTERALLAGKRRQEVCEAAKGSESLGRQQRRPGARRLRPFKELQPARPRPALLPSSRAHAGREAGTSLSSYLSLTRGGARRPRLLVPPKRTLTGTAPSHRRRFGAAGTEVTFGSRLFDTR